MSDLLKKATHARFDAAAALRAKNDPTWRIFNKASFRENERAGTLAFCFVDPSTQRPFEVELEPDWLQEISPARLVEVLIEWVRQALAGRAPPAPS